MSKDEIVAELTKHGLKLHNFSNFDADRYKGRGSEFALPFSYYATSEGKITHKFQVLAQIEGMIRAGDCDKRSADKRGVIFYNDILR